MKKLAFRRTGTLTQNYALEAEGGEVVGTLRRPTFFGDAVATMGATTVMFAPTSFFSEGYAVRRPIDKLVIANYGVEPSKDSFWQRLLRGFPRTGTVTLNGRTYHFTKQKSLYVWSLNDVTVVTYQFAMFSWSGAKGEITISDNLSEEDANILVPLGLHVSMARRDEESSSSGSSATVSGN